MMNNLPTSWAIDTNVLIYFLDKDSSFHQSAKKVFQQSEEHRINLIIAQQNILELIQGLTKWYDLALNQAVKQAKQLLKFNLDVVNPSPQTIDLYLQFCQRSIGTPKKHFDLYLAATLIDNGVTNLVTEDPKGFESIPSLKIFELSKFH